MRIGLDTQTTLGQKTGFGYYVSNLVKSLKKIDHQNQYYFICPKEKRDLSTPKRFWWDQFIFPSQCRSAKVDILHQPCFSVPLFYRGKKVITVHDLAIKYYPKGISFFSRNFFSYWMPFTYHFADHIIADSEYTKKDITKLLHIDKEKISVIPLAIDEKMYNRKKLNPRDFPILQKKFNIKHNYILSVCELHPRKNLEFIINIFARIKNELCDCQLVLAGKKNKYYYKLLSLVKSLQLEKSVVFTDYVSEEEKIILYKKARVLLFPSWYEGFGLPLLEAMSCGCPVISSNTSSMAEILETGGILLSPTASSAWEKAIRKIFKDESFRQEMIKNGLIQAKKFSWEKCALKTIEIYKKIAGVKTSSQNNILVIKNPFESQGFSGGEIHTLQVANFMREKGDNVYFAGTCPDLLNAAKKDGFKTEFLDFAGQEAVDKWSVIKFLFTWPFVYYQYKKFLIRMQQEKNINILYIISWNEKFLLAPLARKLGMKVFFVEHRLLGRYIFWNPFKIFYLYGSKFAKIIAVSRGVRKGLIKLGVDYRRIELIYNGVDDKQFVKVRQKLFSKKPHEFIIGTVSRLSEDKGLEYLMEGVQTAQKNNPNLHFKLKIVGSGPAQKYLLDYARELKIENIVDFMGRLEHDEIPKFLNSIDLFALTSIWGESFGIALAEAGMMGKPSIATNVGGMPEVVEDGKTGLIVPPYDSKAIGKAVFRLASDSALAKKMGSAARLRIKNNFSISAMLNKFDSLFNEEERTK